MGAGRPVGRITPTCVGRTRRARAPGRRGADHPHVRGEDTATSEDQTDNIGSPPRAWGGRRSSRRRCRSHRITPTCVGRTHASCSPVSARADHPHVRGEDDGRTPGAGARLGSPPRAWGGPARPYASARRSRITPTCVGRTTRSRRRPRAGRDHPHVRGEDGELGAARAGVRGSPPRAWGGPQRGRRPQPRQRITPTCVGRTRQRSYQGRRSLDHPHVRGEDGRSRVEIGAKAGSPPRAWGGPSK